MKKLVIANRGAGWVGKSAAILSLINLLEEKGYRLIYKVPQGADCKAAFMVEGVRVGVESQGDPKSEMEASMEEFVSEGCEIIVTACRTKSKTFEKVTEYLGKENGYGILWFAHYVYKTPGAEKAQDFLNRLYAEHVLEIVLDRINNKC